MPSFCSSYGEDTLPHIYAKSPFLYFKSFTWGPTFWTCRNQTYAIFCVATLPIFEDASHITSQPSLLQNTSGFSTVSHLGVFGELWFLLAREGSFWLGDSGSYESKVPLNQVLVQPFNETATKCALLLLNVFLVLIFLTIFNTILDSF